MWKYYHIDEISDSKQGHVSEWVSEFAQSRPTLHDPMDCSLPGSSINGIFQARVMEWVVISFSMSNYTVEVENRYKELDLINSVSEELWMEVCDIVQGQWSRPSPRKRNAKKKNSCLRRQVLQIAVKKKKRNQKQKRKRKTYPSECRVPKNSKER